MWFLSLFLFISSAFGHDAGDIHGSHEYETDLTPIHGALSLENAVRNLGYRMDDVEVVQADYTQGIPAPFAAFASRRHQKWSKRFGKSKLKVRHQRMVDHAILEQVVTARLAHKKERVICGTAHASDTRDVTLSTFGDIGNQTSADTQSESRKSRHQIFYLANENERAAVTHLNPGESVTIVEVIGKPKRKQAKRRIELRKRKHTLSITETDHQQTVCINPVEQ